MPDNLLVLLVEDSVLLATNIGEFLDANGVAVDFAQNGATALGLALTQHYDVLVLDIGLPGLDGLSLCRRLREEHDGTTPILILSARGTLEDKVAGFTAGADDYLTKPFDLVELQMRIQALARRSRPGWRRLVVEDLDFDTASRVVRRGGQVLRLTPSGLRILELLMRRAPAVVSYAEIERMLWGDDPPLRGPSLRVHIHNLRTAIDGDGARPLLYTVHGCGYRLGAGDGP